MAIRRPIIEPEHFDTKYITLHTSDSSLYKGKRYARYSYWRELPASLVAKMEQHLGYKVVADTIEDDEIGILFMYWLGEPLSMGGVA